MPASLEDLPSYFSGDDEDDKAQPSTSDYQSAARARRHHDNARVRIYSRDQFNPIQTTHTRHNGQL